jgi:hypothetical protein
MMCITLSMVLSTMLMAALMVFWMKRHGLLWPGANTQHAILSSHR